MLLREAAARKLASIPKIDVAGKSYLRDRHWPNNYTELQQIVLGALAHARKNTLTREMLEKAGLPGATSTADLRQHLLTLRDDFARAAQILTDDKRIEISRILGVSVDAADLLAPPKSGQ
jgi:DNA-binding NtrC family response regulator